MIAVGSAAVAAAVAATASPSALAAPSAPPRELIAKERLDI